MPKGNVFDYLSWRGDLSFQERPFNEIDALILNIISFLDFEDIVSPYPSKEEKKMSEVIHTFFENQSGKTLSLGLIIPKDMFEVARIAANCKRYKHVRISNYINEVSKNEGIQLAALTYRLDENNIYVTFKGTDDSLIGWAEDVSMLATFPVPAQRDAAKYLTEVAYLYENYHIFVGGHSKGGNLSVYASLYTEAEVQEKIVKVYSLDGPGFYKGTLDLDRLESMKGKLKHIIPQGGVVGRLFDSHIHPTIIRSDTKGLDQHNPLSWMIDIDRFERVREFSAASNNIKKEVDELIDSMSEEDRKSVCDDVYNYIVSLKQDNLLEFANMKNVASLFFNKHKMSKKNKRYLLKLYLIFQKNKAIYIKIQK